MIAYINTLLSPLENIVRQYRKYIGYVIIFLACLVPFLLSGEEILKSSGEKAILVLWIILWMPILARVFGLRIFAQMLPLRQELGILMGVLALVHGFSFIIPNEAYLTSGSAFWSEGNPTFLLFGIIAMWLSVPLTLTSSKWAMRRLGRHWKTLHRLVYVILIFAVAHVVILQSMRQFDITPILFLALYFIFKVLEWRGYSFAKKNSGS